ncbi:MAG: hypothetical protein AB7F31_01255 [Parachlamydiales bacterium]
MVEPRHEASTGYLMVGLGAGLTVLPLLLSKMERVASLARFAQITDFPYRATVLVTTGLALSAAGLVKVNPFSRAPAHPPSDPKPPEENKGPNSDEKEDELPDAPEPPKHPSPPPPNLDNLPPPDLTFLPPPADFDDLPPPPPPLDEDALEKPAQQNKPTNSLKPAQPLKPENSLKPAQQNKPTNSLKPAQPLKPENSLKPAQQNKPTNSLKPAQQNKPSKSISSSSSTTPTTNQSEPKEKRPSLRKIDPHNHEQKVNEPEDPPKEKGDTRTKTHSLKPNSSTKEKEAPPSSTPHSSESAETIYLRAAANLQLEDNKQAIEELKRASQMGHAKASLLVGKALDNEDPEVQTYLEAAIKHAGDSDNETLIEAQYKLGAWWYYLEPSTPESNQQAEKYLSQASNGGHKKAPALWGTLLHDSDKDQELSLYQLSVDRGYTKAYGDVGVWYRDVKDYAAAFDAFMKGGYKKKALKIAEQAFNRHIELKAWDKAFSIAKMLSDDGQEKIAFECFDKLSDEGHVEATFRLGECYEYGWGCDEDIDFAYSNFRTAATKNHPEAMYKVAQAFVDGEAVDTDWDAYKEWLFKAANAKWPEACGELASQLLLGNDLFSKNTKEAFHWANIGADLQDLTSSIIKGTCLCMGNGVKKDLEGAIECFNAVLAVDSEELDQFDDQQSHSVAHYGLGQCYEAKEDPTQALKHYRKSTGPEAQKAITRLNK